MEIAGKPSRSRLNPKQRRFCEELANGHSQVEAYRLAFGKRDRAQASKLAGASQVRTHLSMLQGMNEQKHSAGRVEILAMLSAIVRAKPSDASLDNPLCEIRTSKAGLYPVFPDKVKCIERMAKMLGWDKPTEMSGALTVKVVIGGDA